MRALRVRVLEGADTGLEATLVNDTLSIGTADANDVVLHDPLVSRFHAEVRRRSGAIWLRDQASTNGTHIGPVTLRAGEVTVASGTTITVGATKLVIDDADRYIVSGTGPDHFGGLAGRSTLLRDVMRTLAQIAASDIAVLIQGESGTGKELAARGIHDASARAEHPFVTVDCGAIAPTLFASELFGHEKGAFTSADRRHIGAFERAAGGTLFLDEIGELSVELQVALLGALERKRARRVGGTTEVPFDVRVIAATHRDLRAAINTGAFRLDLYYRIAAVRVTMPPLRDRLEDIPMLVHRALEELGREADVDQLFPPETLRALALHDWPGNVRELRHVVHGTVALGQTPELDAGPRTENADPIAAVLEQDFVAAKRAVVEIFERRWLTHLLKRTDGNVRAAAREGNIERKHLAELLRRHGLR